MSFMGTHPEVIRIGTKRRECHRGATNSRGGPNRFEIGISLDRKIIGCPSHKCHTVAARPKAMHGQSSGTSTASGASHDVAEGADVTIAWKVA